MLRSLLFFMVCSVASACDGSSIVLDAGPTPDAGGPTGRLTLESEPSVTLTFGEESELAVRYTESDVPVADVEVRFALEGRAHDSTLQGDLALRTDAEGRARIRVLAGSVPAVFRARASADRAAPIYVDVSVGNMGFGALTVGAVYAGRREAAVRRVVSVYSEMSCAELVELPPFPDRTMTLEDSTVSDVHFVALPAGISYAVAGRVESAGRTVLATACADGVVIEPEVDTRVDLVFEDAALELAYDYDVDLALAPATTSLWVAEMASAAGRARVDLAGGGASLYLDALELELRDRGADATADALALERATGLPDASLGTELDAASAGPAVAVLALAERIEARLSMITVGGPLTTGTADGAITSAWLPSRIAAGDPGDPDSPPLLLDATFLALAPAPSISLAWRADSDVLEVSSLELHVPLGQLTEATLEAEAAARGLTELSALLVEGAGCDVFATWVSESATIAPSCDASCAEAACMRALGAVMESIQIATSAADEARNLVSLAGTIDASERDGDLTVDVLTGTDLAGAWTGSLGDPGDPVEADLAGTRVDIGP